MPIRWIFASLLGVFLIVLVVVAVRPIFNASAPGTGGANISILGKNAFSPGALEAAPQKKAPVRKWDVLDPPVSAEAVLVYSLDDDFPFLSYNTYKSWPMASLTKLLAAVVVTEEVTGANQRVPISEAAVETEGEAGGLRSGEVYSVRDLLHIMLMTSSNDAAAAFEEYMGGREKFIGLMNEKVTRIGMVETTVFDGSGLSEMNASSASDILKLIKYVAKNNPELLSWTRVRSMFVQPTNDTRSRQITNINPFVTDPDFIGGKTGTLPKAGENFVAVFSYLNRRVAVVVLGSRSRINETTMLLEWVKNAYELQ